jgi:hypothetical protein
MNMVLRDTPFCSSIWKDSLKELADAMNIKIIPETSIPLNEAVLLAELIVMLNSKIVIPTKAA